MTRSTDRTRDASQSGELRSFGRRRGRRPSARQEALLQQVLPRAALDVGAAPPPRADDLFQGPVNDVWLEIGFGGGEHLLGQAARHPRVGFIGCEPYQDGVIKVVRAIAVERLGNIRLLADDARPLLRWLPAESIGRGFVLFPDPWPKERHRKRRLVNEAFIGLLARVMRPGAQLRIATDVGDYASAVLLAAKRQGSFGWAARTAGDWRRRGADQPETRYEAKAVATGRRCYYLTLRRL